MRNDHPAILAVDDDPRVLRAVSEDLRARYADRYRILPADSGESALETVRELKRRGSPIALILTDQRMPGLTGVELLGECRELFPETKAVLLTAYADTDVAITAINKVRADYYILKPWDPPEVHLYPILDELLYDWRASYYPPFEGARVIGNRWSADSHRIRDYLARNQVPFHWLDLELSSEAKRLLGAAGDGQPRLPLVVLADGRQLEAPGTAELADALGLVTRPETPYFELLIIGGGPGGLAAAVYGASEGLHTGLVEREAPGGQAGQSSRIENYLGFPSGLSGADLARRALAQARRFGTTIMSPVEVVKLEITDPYRVVHLADGTTLSCNALIIATGVSYRRLDAPGIDGLTGAGIYYGAAMTEGLSCEDEDILVVGGANSAGQASMFFAGHARNVTMLVRAPSLREGMSSYLVDQIEATENVTVRARTEVVEVKGDDHLERVTVRDLDSGLTEELSATAMFIFIGAEPHTDWLEGIVMRDERGFVLTGSDIPQRRVRTQSGEERDRFMLETSVPGVFAVGDVRSRSVKRVASAVGEGSIAVQFVHQYLAE